MTLEAPWTAVRDTPNKSIRQPVARRGVVLHGAAMTSFEGLRRLCMGAKQVSATAIVKDDEAELLMDAGRYRAWSLSSAWGDSAFRSIETANDSVLGWTFSDKSVWMLARVVAYWAQEDGFWPHREGPKEGWTVVGHREMLEIYDVSYSTACPQSMPVDLVVERAQAILTADKNPTHEEPEEQEMSNGTRYIERVFVDEHGVEQFDGEWMVVSRDFGPQYDDAGQLVRRGFKVTDDWDVASVWAALYGLGSKCAPIKRTRDAYIAIQSAAVAESVEYEEFLASIGGKGTEA